MRSGEEEKVRGGGDGGWRGRGGEGGRMEGERRREEEWGEVGTALRGSSHIVLSKRHNGGRPESLREGTED